MMLEGSRDGKGVLRGKNTCGILSGDRKGRKG